jgi:hypothetical protein
MREHSVNKVDDALDDTSLAVAMAELVRVSIGKLDNGIIVHGGIIWKEYQLIKL